MRTSIRVVSVAGILFLYGTLPAAEDVTIVYNVSRPEGGAKLSYKYISPGRAEAWSGPDYGSSPTAPGS